MRRYTLAFRLSKLDENDLRNLVWLSVFNPKLIAQVIAGSNIATEMSLCRVRNVMDVL